MTLFINKKEEVEVSELSAEQAQKIYEALKAGKNENQLFKEGISFEDSGTVTSEIKRLESEILSKMNGTFVITPRVLAEYEVDEEGNQVETKPYVSPTYYKLSTEVALKESLKSDLLKVETLVADVRAWHTEDSKLTWTAFKDCFKEE